MADIRILPRPLLSERPFNILLVHRTPSPRNDEIVGLTKHLEVSIKSQPRLCGKLGLFKMLGEVKGTPELSDKNETAFPMEGNA